MIAPREVRYVVDTLVEASVRLVERQGRGQDRPQMGGPVELAFEVLWQKGVVTTAQTRLS